jgi:hypothetical protein
MGKLIALVLLAAPLSSGVMFRVAPRPGNTFRVELQQEDGGVFWREQSARLAAPRQGWFAVTAAPGKVQPGSGRVWVSFSRDDGGELTCSEPIAYSWDAGHPNDVFAAELPDGGCHLRVFDPTQAARWLKENSGERRPARRNEAGDFPPYVPPYTQPAVDGLQPGSK